MNQHIQPRSLPFEPPAPAPARADDDPLYADRGLNCPRCRIVIATTIPLRCCPRCGKRLPNVPADPNEEPLEALGEKIDKTRFVEGGWIGWNRIGCAVGLALGGIVATVHVDWWRPDPLRKTQTVIEVFAWYVIFGALVGNAVGVCYTSIVRPVWLALFDSKRFAREWCCQERKPDVTDAKEE